MLGNKSTQKIYLMNHDGDFIQNPQFLLLLFSVDFATKRVQMVLWIIMRNLSIKRTNGQKLADFFSCVVHELSPSLTKHKINA